MKLAAVGALPSDVVTAIRSGTVKLQRECDNVVVFCDEASHISWRCELVDNIPGKEMEPVPYRHQTTGESGTVHIPRISAVTRCAPPPAESLTGAKVGRPAPAGRTPDSTSSSALGATELLLKYRPLVMKVVHHIAPSPCDTSEIMRLFYSEGAGVLRSILNAFTVLGGRGQRELTAAGYELIDVESYDSKVIKQRVADRALLKIAHNKALVDRFSLYADRDVLLTACSKGIMAGLGSSAKKRSRGSMDDDEGSDEISDDNETEHAASALKPAAEGSGSAVEKGAAALFTSMSQSYIRWNDADLTREPWQMPPAVGEVLLQLRHTEEAAKVSADRVLPSMPIVSQEHLSIAREHYAALHKEYTSIYDRLKRLEGVAEEARGWIQSHGDRFTSELNSELQSWFGRQEGPRLKLVEAMDNIHEVLYRLKRDIEDYVNLREWGVLR